MSTLYTVAATILARVQAELEASPSGWPSTARNCVVPGLLAWDECDCGLLAVEFNSMGYANSFPSISQIASIDNCFPYAVTTYTVTALRCAPSMGKNGEPPTCAALDAAAQTFYDDVECMLRGTSKAVMALDAALTINASALGTVLPAGPQGGCVGVTQQVTVGFPNRWSPCV
jgi:hypothetical protein